MTEFKSRFNAAMKSFGRLLWRALKKIGKFFKMVFENKQAAAGMIIMFFFLFMLVVLTQALPYDATPDPYNLLAKPSWAHPFGTDELGRDLMRRLIAGSSSVLGIAFLTGLFTVTIGVVLGLISGLAGGITDKIIMTVTNLVMTVPTFPIMLVLAQVATITNVAVFSLILSALSWAGLCRAVRSQIISVKERDFIQICRVMHMSKAHIIFKELLPNVFSYIAINFVMAMRNAITASVGIMLVGLAAYDPTNWGAIMNAARTNGLANVQNIRVLMYPLVAIIVFQIATLMLANGLDETLNPRLKVL